jgi:hypothetical protein
MAMVGGAAAAWPFAASAQQKAMPVIGFLGSSPGVFLTAAGFRRPGETSYARTKPDDEYRWLRPL